MRNASTEFLNLFPHSIIQRINRQSRTLNAFLKPLCDPLYLAKFFYLFNIHTTKLVLSKAFFTKKRPWQPNHSLYSNRAFRLAPAF